MSFMDKAKDALTQAKGKAADLADQHGGKIEQSITKAGDFVDKKTGGKHAGKIDQVQAKARQAAEKLAAERTEPGGAVVGETPVPVPGPIVSGPVQTGSLLKGDLVGGSDPVVGDPVVTDHAFPAKPAFPTDPVLPTDPGAPQPDRGPTT